MIVAICGLLIASGLRVPAAGGTSIKLKNEFVDYCADRVSLSGTFSIYGLGPVHDLANDGEIHIGGALSYHTADGELRPAGMACVAELMHAKDRIGRPYLNLIRSTASDGSMNVAGVWRLWSEHGAGNFVQRSSNPSDDNNSNPNHVFEIHPLLEVDGQSVISTLTTMEGFNTLDGEARTRSAFRNWSQISCRIHRTGRTSSIVSSAHKYNFVRMIASINSRSQLADGVAYDATVYDWTGNHARLASHVRIVVPDGCSAAEALHNTIPGAHEKLALVGFPRVSLNKVRSLSSGGSDYEGPLPYELVIVTASPVSSGD